MSEKRTRMDHIKDVEKGMLVAFKNDTKMVAAKVTDIKHNGDEVSVSVETKNGSVYHIDLDEIVWVKTGSRWPTGIYNALKESR